MSESKASASTSAVLANCGSRLRFIPLSPTPRFPVRYLLALTLATLPLEARSPTRAAGEWVFEMAGDPQPQRVTLTPVGDSLEGRVYGQAFRASLVRNQLRFGVGDYRWRGELRGDKLTGWLGIGSDSSRWQARRYRPPAAPRSFTLVPTSWARGVAAGGTPVLRLYPGDTVHTTTVDAGGWDARPRAAGRRTPGGNPLTGPFYVEGAVPGDVLVVRLHRVRLNRDWAFSGTGLIDNAITPAYAAERKETRTDNQWVLDTLAGVARLREPPAGLAGFTVPLRPFLGVVAVAPGGEEVPSSRASGSWGGNMELAALREGATLYLPVSSMGAYLYLGDGHAAQGDGELTGDAMEASMAVTFSVEVKRWGFGSTPRVETAEEIMSVGVGGSVDEALRTATSDLARWLTSDYGLTDTEAAIVLGMRLRYDVPDLVPPNVGVVVRVAKEALPIRR